MARHKKTLVYLAAAVEVLTDYHPMTVRQVYYQLVSRQSPRKHGKQIQGGEQSAGGRPQGWHDTLGLDRRPAATAAICGHVG